MYSLGRYIYSVIVQVASLESAKLGGLISGLLGCKNFSGIW